MAQLAMIAGIAGGGLSALGTLAAGNSAEKAANFEASQLQRNAGLARAASQRAAIEERRKADLVSSRALAVAAASGGGTGGNVENILGDIAAEGEYRTLTSLFEGEQQAQGLETAAGRRWEGKAAKRASRVQAVSTLLGSAGSMYGKYGGSGAFGGGEAPKTLWGQ